MIIYITVDKHNYVDGWGSTQSNNDDIKLILDKEHEFFHSDFNCWKYKNDELVFDEEKRDRLIAEREQEVNEPSEMDLLRQENETLALAMMDLAEIILNGGDV